MQYCEIAHAKVNLHLEVLQAREDGYHNLLSVMACVGLSDLLKLDEFELSTGTSGDVDVTIITKGGRQSAVFDKVPVEKNLITKAANAYCRRVGKSARIIVSVEKNIPAGGGLGGGSSDAAAMLRLLEKAIGPIGDDALHQIAGSIGADVPFCLKGGVALCEGKGEIIEALDPIKGYTVLIANDGTHVDTGAAYRMIDGSRVEGWESPDVRKTKAELRRILESGVLSDLRGVSINDFEIPVFAEYPQIERLKDSINKYGAVFSTMTGSGSTVIGLFDDDHSAKRAGEYLSNNGVQVELTGFVS
jgi:4-diphosphocytidyl-2-C-methyl-D-erythritol kinase